MNDKQKEKIKNMRIEGKSYLQIASILSINENTIKAFCRRNKLASSEDPKPDSEKEIYTNCKHCGKKLNHGTKGQPKKFCSEECRRAWWKANNSELTKKAYYTFRCTECGKEFKSYGNKNRKFCSHDCYINNRFKKEGQLNESGAV